MQNNPYDDDEGEEDDDEQHNEAAPFFPPNEFGCTESQRLSPLHWNHMARLGPETVGSAFTSPHSDITTTIRKTLAAVSGGTGCFVQGSPSLIDEAAHVLESWRKNPERAEHTTAILRQLGVVPANWFLDHESNLHWLDPGLHKALDLYGLWSWTLSLDSIARLMAALKMERAARQVVYDETGNAPWRKWNPTWVHHIEFNMIIMNPWLANRPLIREVNGIYLAIYGHQEGHFHQDLPSGAPVLPFHVLRPAGSELNPFLVALSCLHKLQIHFRRRELRRLPPEASPHFTLYTVLHNLSAEIWAPLTFNPPPPAQTMRISDAGRRSRRVEPINTIFTDLGEGGSGSTSNSGRGDYGGGGDQGGSQGGMGSQEQLATDTSAISQVPLDIAAGSADDPSVEENVLHVASRGDEVGLTSEDESLQFSSNAAAGLASTHVIHPGVEEPDPSPLDALESMTVEERVVFGSDLFFKPLLPWGDECPEDDGRGSGVNDEYEG
ncbi:hypothetical protein FB451DRAFT_71042 [Mycena latifolia]|nr:hypothetical protein FB451DRAFT_71042 [Mycena latifolia]